MFNTRQTAKTQTVPAPIGGLNGRDGLAAMDPSDAYLMDNWFPGTGTVDARKGSASHATGLPGACESLLVYGGGSSRKLLAFSDGKVYDASLSGAVGAALATGRVSNRVVGTMFSNAGNQFLITTSTVTGDEAISYDGAAVADLAITYSGGPTLTDLVNVMSYKGRLYFARDNDLSFYYLPVGNIAGALAKFDLTQVAKLGGYLVGFAAFSADAGDGPDDYAVFITSMGEYIVYAGYDPSSAANWSLVGRYYAAPPIGRNCTFNYGAELIIITLDGAVPFSVIRTSEASDKVRSAITSKLGRYLQEHNQYSTSHGWQGVMYPSGGMLLLNVPASAALNGTFYQFVQNTTTRAWTRFTNLNGICWAVYENSLYFGTYGGVVKKADTGKLDSGEAIQLQCKQAFHYFGSPGNKHFHFAKMLLASEASPPVDARLIVDYLESDLPEYTSNSDMSGSPWDTSSWDTSGWGADVTTQYYMAALGVYGVAGSLWMRAAPDDVSLKWYATQYIYSEAQGVL